MDFCRYYDNIFTDYFDIFNEGKSNSSENLDIIDVEFTETVIDDEITKM